MAVYSSALSADVVFAHFTAGQYSPPPLATSPSPPPPGLTLDSFGTATSLSNGTLLYQESVQGVASMPITVFGGLVLTDDVEGRLTGARVDVAITAGFDSSGDGVPRDQLLFSPISSNVTISLPFNGATGYMTLVVGQYTDATYVQVPGGREGRSPPERTRRGGCEE